MPRFAANLTILFTEHAFLDRFGAAAASGFRGVEFLFPYAFEVDQIADRLQSHKLELVLHNLPAGNWEAGERGIDMGATRTEIGIGVGIEKRGKIGCRVVDGG